MLLCWGKLEIEVVFVPHFKRTLKLVLNSGDLGEGAQMFLIFRTKLATLKEDILGNAKIEYSP